VETNLTDELHEYGQYLFGIGGEYLLAAEVLQSCEEKKWLPIYFLICQSLELSLKSFLAERGYDKGRLKKLGHDLMKCLDQAGRNGLEFSLSQERTNEMERISAYYAGKHLEYFFKQEKAFPNLEDIMSFVKIL
jgi:HEPN domain-containing protein